MKIPFDIKFRPQIESGEYKVETREGLPVRIICWDRLSQKYEDDGLNLCVLVPDDEGEAVNYYHRSGKRWVPNDDYDLFIITPEPGLSEFEQEIENLLNLADGEGHARTTIENTKRVAAEVLALARKELEPEVLERLEAAYKNQDEVVYENGKRDGKAEALEDLPRWKPAATAYDGDRLPRIDWSLDRLVARFEEGIYYLDIEELYKLPGVNE